eukprot:c55186_g1_i1 orf=206-1330(-)
MPKSGCGSWKFRALGSDAMNLLVVMIVLVWSLCLSAWWQCLKRNSGIDPLPTALPRPPKREGVYARNEILQKIVRIGEGYLPFPEDIAVDKDGNLYTGCADGWVKKVRIDGSVENWTRVGGRPLGLVYGLHGELLVCEPSLGLLNATEGNARVLSNSSGGVQFKFADGIDVAEDGAIYFTDASTKFGFGYSDLDVLEARPNGRLLKYDPGTRTTTLLLSNLYFPNGVAVSSNQKSLIFCETSKVRCQRYWIRGKNRGKVEIFIDNLPGYPDNVHSSGRGTFWIGLVSTRSRLMEFILGFSFVKYFYANPTALGTLNVAPFMAKVLEVNDAGEAMRLFEDPDGKAISFVTSGLEVGDSLYVGCLASDYIGKLDLS